MAEASSFLALPIRLRCNNGRPVFQANHITESLHRQTGKKEVFEFPCGIQRGRIINDIGAIPETKNQGLFHQIQKEVTFCGLPHGADA